MHLAWMDCVVPVAMKSMTFQLDRVHLRLAYFLSRRIFGLVQLALHRETLAVGGRGNQIDNHLVAGKRLAPAVLAYEREQPVLNLVPFAGGNWCCAFAIDN